jgi:hypothetical protein
MSTFDNVFESSLFVIGEEDPETDSLMDSADWLNSKTEDSRPSQETSEEQCNSTDVSDDSDCIVPSGCGIKYRDKCFRIPFRSD